MGGWAYSALLKRPFAYATSVGNSITGAPLWGTAPRLTRRRVMPVVGLAADIDLKPAVYGGGDALWSDDSGNPLSAGHVLIADEDVDHAVVSVASKGDSLSVMLFGSVRSAAERLSIQSVKLMFRRLGASRRRKGR